MITPEHNNPYPGVMKLTIKLTILSSSLLYTYEGLSDRFELKHLSVDQWNFEHFLNSLDSDFEDTWHE